MKLHTAARLFAVSATAPNIEDVARWLGQGRSKGRGLEQDCGRQVDCERPAMTLRFGEEYRPVALKKYCLGYPQTIHESDFQFEHKLNLVYLLFGKLSTNEYRLMDVVQQYSESKPILVFCSTRKQAQDAAQAVLKQYEMLLKNGEHVPWKVETFSMGPLANDLLKGNA
jgi:ATP-dependent DNA helicase HFM1/MER3